MTEPCPICSHLSFSTALHTKDYYFSGQNFDILKCNQCGFRLTSPRPNQHEIGQYYNSENYISHNSNAKGFINRVYTTIQKLNFRLKFNSVSKYVPRGTWMDYGAGNGAFISYLLSKKIYSIGYEPSIMARQNTSGKIELKDTKEYSIDTNEYACITMWHVLEHVHNFKDLILNHKKHLIKNGILVVAVPNIDSYDSAYYREFWAALDAPRHLWHFNEHNIQEIARQTGLDLISIKPMLFDSFYVSLLSAQYKESSKIIAFFIGLLSNLKALISDKPFSSQIYILRKNS